MGFSVSASAAIVFISFLIAASTLYTAWDNSYSNVQAARDDWYDLRLSRLNTLVALNSSLGTYSVDDTNNVYNVTFYIQSTGVTMYVPHWSGVYDGNLVTLYNVDDDNVGFLSDYTYLVPPASLELNVTNINLDSTVHNLTVTFGNGCWLRLSWHYDSNNNRVVLDSQGQGCPTEVS